MKKIYKTYNAPLPVKTCWELWTSHLGLKQFFGIDNQMELKLFAPFEIYFSTEAPEGMRGSEGCKVLAFDEEKMFSFSWNAPPSIPLARNSGKQTFVILYFHELDTENTRLELIHSGWIYEGAEWEECYDYFDKAWGVVFEWFGNALARYKR